MKSGNNIKWVDIAKGLVISLMVIGHTSIPGWISNWIWSFHMPFFFVISALFTNWERGTLRSFVNRKAKILLIPFVVYSLVDWLLLAPVNGLSYSEYGYAILTKGWNGIALWFVPVFFLSILITRYCAQKYAAYLGAILILSGAFMDFIHIHLPWTLSSVPFCAGLMLLVKSFKMRIRRLLNRLQLQQVLIMLFLGALLSLVISQKWRLDLCYNSILPLIPISLGIVGGCAMAFAISILIDKYGKWTSTLFSHIGKNTYEIMALSQAIIMVLNHYFVCPMVIKYLLLILTLSLMILLRKAIEGRFAKTEAI